MRSILSRYYVDLARLKQGQLRFEWWKACTCKFSTNQRVVDPAAIWQDQWSTRSLHSTYALEDACVAALYIYIAMINIQNGRILTRFHRCVVVQLSITEVLSILNLLEFSQSLLLAVFFQPLRFFTSSNNRFRFFAQRFWPNHL